MICWSGLRERKALLRDRLQLGLASETHTFPPSISLALKTCYAKASSLTSATMLELNTFSLLEATRDVLHP